MKNTVTNHSLPFDRNILFDRHFTNIAQAVIKKKIGNISETEINKKQKSRIFGNGCRQKAMATESQIIKNKEYIKMKEKKLNEMLYEWYDDNEKDREPGWPKWFEYCKRLNINDEPVRDKRPFII